MKHKTERKISNLVLQLPNTHTWRCDDTLVCESPSKSSTRPRMPGGVGDGSNMANCEGEPPNNGCDENAYGFATDRFAATDGALFGSELLFGAATRLL